MPSNVITVFREWKFDVVNFFTFHERLNGDKVSKCGNALYAYYRKNTLKLVYISSVNNAGDEGSGAGVAGIRRWSCPIRAFEPLPFFCPPLIKKYCMFSRAFCEIWSWFTNVLRHKGWRFAPVYGLKSAWCRVLKKLFGCAGFLFILLE